MRRIAPFISAVLLSAAAPAAHAADPLLSGYGGPGGGEQAVLGEEVLPGGGGSGGSGSGSSGGGGSGGAPATAAPRPLRAAPAPVTQGAELPAITGAPAAPRATTAPATPRRSTAGPPRKRPARTLGTPKVTATEAARPGAPPTVPYPSRASSASGLPLTLGDLVMLVLAGGALALVAAGLQRLRPLDGATG